MKNRLWAPLVGALLVASAALAVVVSHAEPRLAGTNNVRPAGFITQLKESRELCQPNEILPNDAAGIRLVTGARNSSSGDLQVTVRNSSGQLAKGQTPVKNGPVTVPISRSPNVDLGPVTVCLRNESNAAVRLAGTAGPPAGTQIGEREVQGAVALEYLREGRESWLALAPTMARRFGLAKASWVGPWTFWLVLVAIVILWTATIGLSLRVFRDPGRLQSARGLHGAAGCIFVAVLNAALWSLMVPPFHVPDETVHLGYAQYVAEEGRPPPQAQGPQVSPEEAEAINKTYFNQVVGNPRGRPPWNRVAASPLDENDARSKSSRRGGGGASSASNNPPTYYTMQAVPYWLGSSTGFLDRFALMRLLSALLAGLTTFGIFLFLRELLPGRPWAWTIGALGAGLQPTFSFIAGGVNNDNLLFAAAAWLFFLIARSFRAGLSPKLGVAIGLVTAAGLLSKSTMLGLTPAVFIALLIHVVRAGPEHRRRVLRAATASVACLVVPLVGYVALSTLVWDRALFSAAGSTAAKEATVSLAGRLSYEWQFYLPRLPFMTDLQPGYPALDVWFRGFIGRFGWLDYGFPLWVYDVALAVWAILIASAAAALLRFRHSLRRRLGELAVYLVAVASLASLIAFAGYEYRLETGFVFEQARYLLPLLALYGAILSLVVLGAPARWRPTVAGVVIVLALAHNLFSQLITLSRFYG